MSHPARGETRTSTVEAVKAAVRGQFRERRIDSEGARASKQAPLKGVKQMPLWQNGPVFHARYDSLVKQDPGLVCEGRMNGRHVRVGKQCIKIHKINSYAGAAA